VLLADETRLVLRRKLGGQSLLAVFNIAADAAAWPAEIPAGGRVLAAVNEAEPGSLPAWGGLWIIEGETA
jgi:alpha-glucosidase